MGKLLLIVIFYSQLFIFNSANAASLPPILQVLEKTPSTLEDIEELVSFRWFDKAWEALQTYPAQDEKTDFLKAKTLMGLKRYEEALESFKTLAKGASSPEIRRESLLKVAMVLTRLKRYEGALQVYHQLAIQENHKRKRQTLAWREFKTALEAKDYEEGLRVLRGLTGPQVLWWRGWCLFRLQNLEGAIKNWRLLSPRHHKDLYSQSLYWQAIALENLNRQSHSKAILQELVEKYSLTFYGFLARFKLNISSDDFISKIPLEKYPKDFDPLIYKEAKLKGLDPFLIYSMIWQESRFKEEALSSAGAIGLMQLMPQTALQLFAASKTKHFQLADILNPEVNVRLGCFYMRFLKQLFDNRIPYALAAYNAGEEAMSRWLSLREEEPVEIVIEEIPFDETRGYVKKVLAFYWVYHWLYDGKLPEGPGL